MPLWTGIREYEIVYKIAQAVEQTRSGDQLQPSVNS